MIDKLKVKEQINYDTFYSQFFDRIKRTGNELIVNCPFHHDKNPSMSINIKTGLFFCHGCGIKGDHFEFYQKKTGKSFSDAVDEVGQQIGVQPVKPRIVKEYNYYDLAGELVSQTVRYEPKKFSQRTKKNGQWVWSLKGVETVLYNLKAISTAKQVLLLEGEKDCDTAHALGYLATTCPMGAGKWKSSYTHMLEGKEVILCPDNDTPGIKHMLEIGKILQKSSNVKWFDYPNANHKGYDFTDLVNSFNNDFKAMEQIDSLIRSARVFDPAKIIIPEPDSPDSKAIKEWIMQSPGEFNTRDIDYDLGFDNPAKKQTRTSVLEKFVAEKILSREGKRRGCYRPYKTELERIDFLQAQDNFVPLILPLNIHKMVGIMPGNIIIIAGEPNAGKTAMLLNIVKSNMSLFNVHYFNSEMGAGELQGRLKKFEFIGLKDWTFNAYSRDADFADVVFTGEKSLNIIDFLEVHDDFYAVGEKIKQIHTALNGGIAIIAIQKNKGVEFGLGGQRTMEKARLVVNVEPGRFKITKAKNFINPKNNPNGMTCEWKLRNGCDFVMQSYDWARKE